MLVLDRDNEKILDANPAAAAFYGYSIEQMSGMDLGQIQIISAEDLLLETARANKEGRSYLVLPHRMANDQIAPG